MEKSFKVGNGNLTLVKNNSNTIIIFSDFTNSQNNHIRLTLDCKEAIQTLISNLEQFCKVPIKKCNKAYTEGISTYKNEVERSLDLSRYLDESTLYLTCYTDKEYDDNWIELTQKRLATFIGLLYGHLNS